MTDPGTTDDDRKVMYVVIAGLVVGCAVLVVLLALRTGTSASTPAAPGVALGPSLDYQEDTQDPFGSHFTDVAGSSGLDFIQRSGAQGELLLPETMGSGVALGDLDSDGDSDLLLLSVGGLPGLFVTTPCRVGKFVSPT